MPQRDVRVKACRLYFLPAPNRIPLKFGRETVHGVTCARAAVRVEDGSGRSAWGWGETPLSVSWLWPSSHTPAERDAKLRELCGLVAKALPEFPVYGHPMELGHLFTTEALRPLWRDFSADGTNEPAPWLSALACFSPFDIAVHDAYASLHGRFVYDIYNGEFMNRDLSWYYGPGAADSFAGTYPGDYFGTAAVSLPAWHLVGGKDRLTREEALGDEPDDGYPVFLDDWIRRDGLSCLKIKLGGVDAEWDYNQIVRVAETGAPFGVKWLCADFNCTVEEPAHVTGILNRLASDHPRLFEILLYVEQPFQYDLEERMLDVRAVSARKPLFLDESAHDWTQVRLGRDLGWNGVALKTCKTQTGALLSLCWAKRHGMSVMVQDLTNPMLAQIPHLLLAAHADTLMGVETNSMQFCPEASLPESRVHPGLYIRRNGRVDLRSIGSIGFGYRTEEIGRILPEPFLFMENG